MDDTRTRKHSDTGATGGAETAARARRAALRDHVVDLIADVFADAGRTLGGDLRAAALLVVLRQTSLRASRAARLSGASLDALPCDWRGMTQSGLSAVTGISRETVRRKLTAMERMGWVERQGMVWVLPDDGSGDSLPLSVADLQERHFDRVLSALAAANETG